MTPKELFFRAAATQERAIAEEYRALHYAPRPLPPEATAALNGVAQPDDSPYWTWLLRRLERRQQADAYVAGVEAVLNSCAGQVLPAFVPAHVEELFAAGAAHGLEIRKCGPQHRADSPANPAACLLDDMARAARELGAVKVCFGVNDEVTARLSREPGARGHSTVYGRGEDAYVIDGVELDRGGVCFNAQMLSRPATDAEALLLERADAIEHRDNFRSATLV
jgi:hypothetical protein